MHRLNNHNNRSLGGRARALTAGLAILAANVGCNGQGNSPQPIGQRVANVSVSPVNVALPAGQTFRLRAVLADAAGNKLEDRTTTPGLTTASSSSEPVSVIGDLVGRTGWVVTWSSSHPERATVDAGGLVSAVTPGQTTIAATSDGRTGTAQVIVTDSDAAQLVVTPTSAVLFAGETLQLQAFFPNATTARIPATPKWESLEPSRATVSREGLVTAATAGSVAITATAEQHEASAQLSIRPATTVHGLDFPGNAGANSTLRFQFVSPLAAYPATYIWRTYPRQQPSYYAALFWGNNGAFHGDRTYYGFHPYPDWEERYTHFWEIAAPPGADVVSAEHVVYDRWYTQVAVTRAADESTEIDFYWDWPDASQVVRYTGRVVDDPPNPVLTFGDAPWNGGNEVWNGVLRGFQIYDAALTTEEINSEIAAPGSVRSPWYLNLNPKPEDIRDQGPRGNHPAWVGNERPTLWSGLLTEAGVISTAVAPR